MRTASLPGLLTLVLFVLPERLNWQCLVTGSGSFGLTWQGLWLLEALPATCVKCLSGCALPTLAFSFKLQG